ncbi:hypothetical protein [Rufibacter soli]
MKFLGLLLFLVGVASLLMAALGVNHLLLLWVDTWGTAIAWALRFGVTLLGLVLYYVNRHDD